MDSGRISVRYAKAIYEFAESKKEEVIVYEEMKQLETYFLEFPSLREAMNNPTVTADDKEKLLITAAGIAVSDTFLQVLKLIRANRRESYIDNIALMYQEYYRKKKGIVVAKLATVNPVTEEIMNKLRKLIVQDTNLSVDFDAKTNPSLIGGFVVEVDSTLLDASIKSQLNKIRYQLMEMNKNLLN